MWSLKGKYIYIIFFLLIWLNMIVIKVDAKSTLMTCLYQSSNNEDSLKVTIYDDFSHSATITSYNGKSISNNEDVLNWGARGNSYGIQHYVKYSGLCPSHAGILKQAVWGYSVYLGDVSLVTQEVEDYSSHAILGLVNSPSQNIDNMNLYLSLPPSVNCKYQERSKEASVKVPNVYYGGIYYATGGPTGGGQIISEGTCPTNVYKVCLSSNKDKCSYSFSLTSPYLCNSNDYVCTKLPDTRTEAEAEEKPNGNIGEKTYTKKYGVNVIGTSQYGKILTFMTSFDFDKGYSTSTNMTIEGYSKSIGIAYTDITTFMGNVLDPIINSNKWPDKIYCSEMSATMSLTSSVVMIVGDTGGLVCSPMKNVFLGTATLAVYDSSITVPNENNNNNNTDGEDTIDGDNLNPEPIDCSDFVDKEGINIISEIFSILMIMAPILLIVYGTIDFAKASMSGDEQALKKAGTNFGKRTIAAIILFILPFILNVILAVAFDAGIFGNMKEIPETCIEAE